MPATKTNPSNLPSVDEAVPTKADTETPISHSFERRQAASEAWQEVIDRRLIEWGSNPQEFADDGVEPPSSETVGLAISLAQRYRARVAPPDSVVLDANGGIVFEWRDGQMSHVLHVWDDGTIEYQLFHRSHLVERWPLVAEW